MTEEEKPYRYHEGGHALVALNVKATDPATRDDHPRGRALGHGHAVPERDSSR